MIQSPYRTFYTVQALRAFAAILVVIQHSTLLMRDKLGHDNYVFYSGASGVDMFFCISGFVMILMLHKYENRKNGWFDFITKRVLRVVPLYWVLTTIKLLLLLAVPAVATSSQLSIWNTIGSYFFFPAWHPDKMALPIIQVGWTLNFEMFFYTLFAIILALQKRPLIWLTFIMVALGCIGFIRTTEWGALSGLLRPLLFEFVAGMWIAKAILLDRKINPTIATVMIIISFIVICLTDIMPEDVVEGNWRILWWGLPSAVILWSSVSLEKHVRRYLQGTAAFLGNASYSIYLIQGFVMTVVAIIYKQLDFLPVGIQLLSCIIAVIIAGCITHIILEKPMTKILQKTFFK